jgi:hypothetical protein
MDTWNNKIINQNLQGAHERTDNNQSINQSIKVLFKVGTFYNSTT